MPDGVGWFSGQPERGTVVGMLHKGGLLTLTLVAASAGCNDSFECASDNHCELDGVAGFCESIGHCSFPDEACDTGRRFGNLAGTLSNQCVPPAEPEPTTSDASTGSATESEDTGSATGSVTSAQPGASSSGAESSGSSSGEPDLPCTVLYEDSFPGDALDPTWQILGDPVVLGGAVRFAIDPDEFGNYEKIVALGGSRVDLTTGVVTLELDAVPQTIRTQGTLSLEGPDSTVALLWESGGVRPLLGSMSVDHTAMTLPWVRVEFSPGASGTSNVVFSESEDGRDWVEFGAVEDLAFDASDVQVELTAGSYDEFAIPQEFAARWISICGDPSGI